MSNCVPVLLVVKPYGPIRGDRSGARSAERRGATPFRVEGKRKGAAEKLPGRVNSAKSNFQQDELGPGEFSGGKRP